MKTSSLVKIAIGLAAAGVFGLLFVRSLDDARTTPYTVPARHLTRWTVALESTSAPNEPMLVLRPSAELASGLFKQIFSRAMESLNTPVSPSVPLVLRGEFDRALGDQLTPDALLTAARDAGLASAAPVPRCLVHRHVSEPGGVRQVFFVYFDAPDVSRFRRQIGLDADAMSAVLAVAGAGADFNTWLPQTVNPEADCLAPIDVTP